jgi:hypothetical protein
LDIILGKDGQAKLFPFFCFSYFWDRVLLYQDWPGLQYTYLCPIYASCVAKMAGVCPYAQLLVEMGFQELFACAGLKLQSF